MNKYKFQSPEILWGENFVESYEEVLDEVEAKYFTPMIVNVSNEAGSVVDSRKPSADITQKLCKNVVKKVCQKHFQKTVQKNKTKYSIQSG